MARKRSRRQRDTTDISSHRLLSPSTLLELEDRRSFHPDPVRPARGFFRDSVVIGISPLKNVNKEKRYGRKSLFRPDVFRFRVPGAVAVCLRRKQRKEVLFAKRRTGKGSRLYRKRSAYSDVSCR